MTDENEARRDATDLRGNATGRPMMHLRVSPTSEVIVCTCCDHPTMHMGSMCYGCTQAAMLAAARKGE